jgi:hypothetical protein
MANELKSLTIKMQLINWPGRFFITINTKEDLLEPIQIEFLFDSIMQDYPIIHLCFGKFWRYGIKIISVMIFMANTLNTKVIIMKEKPKDIKNFKVHDGQQRLNRFIYWIKRQLCIPLCL